LPVQLILHWLSRMQLFRPFLDPRYGLWGAKTPSVSAQFTGFD